MLASQCSSNLVKFFSLFLFIEYKYCLNYGSLKPFTKNFLFGNIIEENMMKKKKSQCKVVHSNN